MPPDVSCVLAYGFCVNIHWLYRFLCMFKWDCKSRSYLAALTYEPRFLWPHRLRRASAAPRLLELRVRIPPASWVSVSCEFCLLSDRGICVGLITRPEESCWVWCVSECDRETSILGGPGPLGGFCAKENRIYERNRKPRMSSKISPTRCNNCVFILRNGFTLHVSGDNLTHHQEYICCIWPQVSQLT